MRLFLLAALTMVAFAANSVLNRWAVGLGHIGAVEFACIRLAAGALADTEAALPFGIAALLVLRAVLGRILPLRRPA